MPTTPRDSAGQSAAASNWLLLTGAEVPHAAAKTHIAARTEDHYGQQDQVFANGHASL